MDFPVKIDLSAICKDVYHQKIMILAGPKWSTVASIENKIKSMFTSLENIDLGLKSAEGGFYIPPDEPVEILKFSGSLIAFEKNNSGAQHASKESSSSTSKLQVENEILPTADFIAKKKRKHRFLNESGFTTSTPAAHIAKRLKSISQDAEALDDASYSSLNKEKTNAETVNNVLQEVSNKRKTKSVSKNKTASSTSKEIESVASKTNSHVFYDDENMESNVDADKNVNDDEKALRTEIAFVCDLESSKNTAGRARVFQINRKNHESTANPTMETMQSPKAKESKTNHNVEAIVENKTNAVSIIENLTILKPPIEQNTTAQSESSSMADESFKSQSDLEETRTDGEYTESLIDCDDSAVIELNESENPSNDTAESTSINRSNTDETNRSAFINEGMILNALPLTDLPKIGEYIVFKIPLMDGKISDTLVGKCEYINRRTKAIKLNVENHSQLHKLPQKYAANADDSNAFTMINVKLQDMYNPKVIQNP